MTKTTDNSLISPSSPKNNIATVSTKGSQRSKDDLKIKCKKSSINRSKTQRSGSFKSQTKSPIVKPNVIKVQHVKCLQHLKRVLPESS
ncbi:hypothetical protein, partial [Salmonella sp. s54836]|uniref:hypothetical protein n=1 Tax=Salmonella sp. s54836 TaxID=3159673 RepID=UPI003980E7BA